MMKKNPFLDHSGLDVDKILAELAQLMPKRMKRLDLNAKKALKGIDAFKPEKGAKYAEKDPKPEPYIGQAFLVLESFDGDVGDRPLDPRPSSSSALEVLDDQGRPLAHLSAGAELDLRCRVRNLGDLDVSNATVEFFLGDARFHPSNQPFRMVVVDVFTIAGRGLVAVGVVSSGSVSAGERVVIRGENGDVESLISGVHQGRAAAGNNVGLLLRGVRSEQVSRGDVIIKADELGQEPQRATVPDVQFLGSDRVSVDGFGSAEAKLNHTLSTILPSGPLEGVVYARAYSLSPDQLPDDFDALDCATSRLVAQRPVG